MTDSYFVRTATSEDNVLLATMGAETFLHAFGSDNTPEDMQLYLQASFSPEIQDRELAEEASLFLIVERAGDPVGYARLLEGRPPPGIAGTRPIEIVRIYARPQWIGRGVGGALMRSCLREAAARGCDTIWLGVWERNERAIAFYARWGFAAVGTNPFLLGTDLQTDVLMARKVPVPGAI